MIGFLGEYEVTLDSKGRVLLPTDLKKQLTGETPNQFVINRGFEKCLNLYPLENWKPIFDKISKLNDFNIKVRDFQRSFLSGATNVELDSAGRILIPPTLRDYAGLEKDIMLTCTFRKIEIWEKSNLLEFLKKKTREDVIQLSEEVMGGLDMSF